MSPPPVFFWSGTGRTKKSTQPSLSVFYIYIKKDLFPFHFTPSDVVSLKKEVHTNTHMYIQCLSRLPGWTPPPINLRLHVIQDICQRVLYHGYPAHVADLQGEGERAKRLHHASTSCGKDQRDGTGSWDPKNLSHQQRSLPLEESSLPSGRALWDPMPEMSKFTSKENPKGSLEMYVIWVVSGEATCRGDRGSMVSLAKSFPNSQPLSLHHPVTVNRTTALRIKPENVPIRKMHTPLRQHCFCTCSDVTKP